MDTEKFKRMTERDEFGNADIVGIDSADLQLNLGFEEFNKVTNALNRLAEYEEMEEDGRLLKLPCKEGTAVYAIEVDDENFDHFHCATKISEYAFCTQMLPLVGKCVFLTKEEAEAEMKRAEGEKC